MSQRRKIFYAKPPREIAAPGRTCVHEICNILREELRTLKTPEIQRLDKDHGEHHPTMKPLVHCQTLSAQILKLQDNPDPGEENERMFRRLYNKLYFRVISEADIIISSCTFNMQDTSEILSPISLASRNGWISVQQRSSLQQNLFLLP